MYGLRCNNGKKIDMNHYVLKQIQGEITREELQERIHHLLVKAQKSKSNTELLKAKLSEIVNTVLKEDITRAELSSLFELTTDYNLKMTYVVEDAFGRKMWRKFSRVMSEIDDLFEEYDRWQSEE